jgi:Vps16, C-terminal region
VFCFPAYPAFSFDFLFLLPIPKGFGKQVIGMSVSETLAVCVLRRHDRAAERVLSEFKVPRRRWFWIRLRVLLSLRSLGPAEVWANEAVRDRVVTWPAVAAECHREKLKCIASAAAIPGHVEELRQFAVRCCGRMKGGLERSEALIDVGAFMLALDDLDGVARSLWPDVAGACERILVWYACHTPCFPFFAFACLQFSMFSH